MPPGFKSRLLRHYVGTLLIQVANAGLETDPLEGVALRNAFERILEVVAYEPVLDRERQPPLPVLNFFRSPEIQWQEYITACACSQVCAAVDAIVAPHKPYWK